MMEFTFISMHDLSTECKLLYASDSISDVLGYSPNEVVNKSTFDFFHEDDLPLARDRYKNEIEMNHASSLAYVRVCDKEGDWIVCECVFSFVYDVIIAATTIYRRGPRSDGRAMAAPIVRNAFKASRDEMRYEMMTHLSAKFSAIAPSKHKEPRAALILNRFTKKLNILYATYALGDLVGMNSSNIVGISFLDCIDDDCIDGAVDAMNRAKENNSVAYMRFRWKRPDSVVTGHPSRSTNSSPDSVMSDASTNDGHISDPLDIEAVISCASDGLIVVLRLAEKQAPALPPRGLFAVPWSNKPLYPAPPIPSDADGSEMNHSEHTSLDNDILSSIQDISVFVWSLSVNQEVVKRYAYGSPGALARPPTPDLTDVSSISSSGDEPERTAALSG